MKENEEIKLRARAKMDTCAGCRLVEERFNVKNTHTAGYERHSIHTPANRYQVQ